MADQIIFAFIKKQWSSTGIADFYLPIQFRWPRTGGISPGVETCAESFCSG